MYIYGKLTRKKKRKQREQNNIDKREIANYIKKKIKSIFFLNIRIEINIW